MISGHRSMVLSGSDMPSALGLVAIIDDTSVMNFRKNLQHNFPKMRGGAGGHRPFGTFPKIHLF